MSDFKHSDRCLELRSKERLERKAFLERFPGCCQACDASGFTSWLESRGEFWGAPCSEQISEACESCLALGKCPRCGELSFPANFDDLDSSELKCSACGWTEKSPSLPEVTSDADCGCLEDWLDMKAEVEVLNAALSEELENGF